MSCVISSSFAPKVKMRANPAKTCANAGVARVSDKARLRKARQRASLLQADAHFECGWHLIGFNKTKSARRRPLLLTFNNCRAPTFRGRPPF